MSTPLWHDGPLDGLSWDGHRPIAWRVPQGGGDRQAQRDRRRRLAREAIVALSGEHADGVRLDRSPHGAPVVLSPPGWYLGLASRGGHSLIGVARRPIGVDREVVDGAPPLWDMLTETEARELRELPDALQSRAWLRRWTIKEAHAKLVGEPRRIAPDMIETCLIDATRATARFEGSSVSWTRECDGAIETLVAWDGPSAR